jgi:AmmeMemoRadiSam system protein A
MPELTAKEGTLLTLLARNAIAEALGGPRGARPSGAPFDHPGATFVTLYRGEVLHGCMGSLEAHSRLSEDVACNAVSAALRDPRAVPLDLADVQDLTVEVSVLSPLQRIPCTDKASAIAALRPYEDGVLLRRGRSQGTFLPQVWKSIPDPRQFLAELRMKARLPTDSWESDLEVYRYSVEKFIDKPRP